MRHPLRFSCPAMALAGLVALGACTSSPDEPADEEPAGVVDLEPTEHLVRASMALRGVRPSIEELYAVAADPRALDAIVDGYLQSPEFGRTIRDLHNASLLVRVDYPYYPAGFLPKGPLANVDIASLNRSVMEAPLKLVEHVVMNDRPYTEIVTGDYTVVNQVVSNVWANVDYDAGGPSWQVSRWKDRPNAGILSDPWLFMRHQSTDTNANRGRANAMSKALLCYDFLSRDIEIDASINLADPNVVQNAVVENQACASCHQGLDPLASFFQGFFPIYLPSDVTYPFDSYYPKIWENVLGIEMRDPAYFGQAGDTLADLGAMIAADPAFSLCAAQRFYAFFHQVDLDAVPLERAAELQEVLVQSGMNAKALTRAIVLADDFRASHAGSDEEAEALVGMKRVRPEQLATTIADLTGFHWELDLSFANLGRVELPLDSFVGYQVIGGGLDGIFVTRASHTDSATTSLFLQAFAAEAAGHVVQHDFDPENEGAERLLWIVTEGDVDEALLRAQISWLHWRIYGETTSENSKRVGETYGLFRAALDHSGDVRRAWKTTLTAMFQDLKVAYY